MNSSEGTPESVWQPMVRGNLRFCEGRTTHPHQDLIRCKQLTQGQKPKAVVLTCSDFHASVGIIFGQGLGGVFIVHTAGEITDLSVLASLELAVDDLKVSLVIVLSHESCGAVAAAKTALDGGELPGGFQRMLIEKVIPSLLAAHKDGETEIDEFGRRCVCEVVSHIIDRSPEISSWLATGKVDVVGTRYRLGNGRTETAVTHEVSEDPLTQMRNQ